MYSRSLRVFRKCSQSSTIRRLRYVPEWGKDATLPTQTARDFRAEIEKLRAALLALPPALADVPWRVGGWTRKQIVGHLLDSAAIAFSELV